MLTLNAKDYRYIGDIDIWHVFKGISKESGPEIRLVMEVRFLTEDGKIQYFYPINFNNYSEYKKIKDDALLYYLACYEYDYE